MKRTFIVAAKRTPIGAFLGSLSSVHPAVFGAKVVEQLLKETKIPSNRVDEVIVGNALPAGLGMGIARQVSLYAGIPKEVPSYTINMVCGSGMKAMINGLMSIEACHHHVIIVGGTESMSMAPYLLPAQLRKGKKMIGYQVKDHMIDDALTDALHGIHMGVTAENLVKQYQISREEQDAFSIDSQYKAIHAVDHGLMNQEIVPISVPTKSGVVVFDKDEYPNRSTNTEKLSKLRPAFISDGTVTAGNSSGINDGASFMILVSEEALNEFQLTPMAEIIGWGQAGVDPLTMGIGPVPAIQAALERAKLSLKDIELFELNEAFAAQAIAVHRELSNQHQVTESWIKERCNIHGGAIALGHPVGASANRITTTLIHALHHHHKSIGLASLCIGGGMGTAIIVKC